MARAPWNVTLIPQWPQFPITLTPPPAQPADQSVTPPAVYISAASEFTVQATVTNTVANSSPNIVGTLIISVSNVSALTQSQRPAQFTPPSTSFVPLFTMQFNGTGSVVATAISALASISNAYVQAAWTYTSGAGGMLNVTLNARDGS